MPYIKTERRIDIRTSKDIENPGELNYYLTKVCLTYFKKFGKSYTNLNTIIGVLECVKQEFYRREVAPYENAKLKENGDVYT